MRIEDVGLPLELTERVRAEMRPGERVVWVAQPVPSLFVAGSWLTVWLGTPVMIACLIGTVVIWSAGGLMATPLCAPLSVIFIGSGIACASSPWWSGRVGERTAYVITDRRAVVFFGQVLGAAKHRSYPPETLTEARTYSSPDGSGFITIGDHYEGGEALFCGISDVRLAAERIWELTGRGEGDILLLHAPGGED
jgi:hypothetical protein